MLKIKVCVPLAPGSLLTPETKESIQTLKDSGLYKVDVEEVQGLYLHKNREKLIRGYELPFEFEVLHDYYLFVDSDIVFTIEDVKKLIDSGKCFISGIYKRHESDDYCFGDVKNHELHFRKHTLTSESDVEVVDFSGLGFSLIKSSVFEKGRSQRDLYFYKVIYDKDNSRWVDYGEDVAFALNLKERNLNCYVHTDVKVKHITSKEKKKVIKTGKFKPNVNFKNEVSQIVSESLKEINSLSNKIYKMEEALLRLNDVVVDLVESD